MSFNEINFSLLKDCVRRNYCILKTKMNFSSITDNCQGKGNILNILERL